MKHSDINKNAKLFVNSLLAVTKEMQNGLSSLTEEELKVANIDIAAMEKEAKIKIDELHASMKKFDNKIKTF